MSALTDALRRVLTGRRAPNAPRTVVVHTRRGCGLCRVAEQLAREEAVGHDVQFVDVDDDPELQRAYNIRVPVVSVDGVEVAEGQVQPGEIARALSR